MYPIRMFNSVLRCVFQSPKKIWNSGGVVVKLLACGARGLGFECRSRRYDFKDWLSPAPSRDMAERSLKRRKSSKQPTPNQSKNCPLLKNTCKLLSTSTSICPL